MIYDVRQVTTHAYEAPVPFAQHMLRQTPIDRPRQRVLAAALAIDPLPSLRVEARDFFGNAVTRADIETAHEALVVTLTARIEVTSPPRRAGGDSPPWEEVRRAAAQWRSLASDAPVHHLFASRHVPLVPAIQAYAAPSFGKGRPILEALDELAARMKADFVYDQTATEVTTPVAESFEMRRGVCQDFAHIMIAALRGLGLPAAYVSGFLRTLPPPGRKRLEGADAPHAWVSVWCGEPVGWIGVDPTNAMRAGEDHLTLAIGRDYADVAPLDGIILASGDQRLAVSVDVIEVDDQDDAAASAERPAAVITPPAIDAA